MVTDLVPKDKPASFGDKLRQRAQQRRSWLCVGIDPELERLPSGVPHSPAGVVQFCRAIMDATTDYAVAFKLNFAFFEALGIGGWTALHEVRTHAPDGALLVADAKRADIANTSRFYAEAVFDRLGFDAVTVSPYLGRDSLQPFLEYRGKGVFILSKTSNPGASDLQDLEVDGEPLYLRVATTFLDSPAAADVGFVVGATQPEALSRVRALSEDTLLLVPGVGAQGASAGETMPIAGNSNGDNALISVSRDVLFASSAPDFPKAAAAAARQYAAETWPAERANAGR